ncbi:hypothetical protein BC939DRAFT_456631 [Gamsiella multidivaricata]|uniref:uncharacterized protein n=1 Tax=Gamsiella multidivaricata TaxID=101098 RepID=UPI0022204BCC|nr:uncharacterized protein BC939DRAFT_456631 [Gamsiella multidivaricata]KAG0365311.1 hypothetical protein BGZ54_006675 [Gamsiella multidivaricata]KAI7820943.1 hypothetical protein BC939DRAFT_456631 [Gamsiella multidivaricata]
MEQEGTLDETLLSIPQESQQPGPEPLVSASAGPVIPTPSESVVSTPTTSQNENSASADHIPPSPSNQYETSASTPESQQNQLKQEQHHQQQQPQTQAKSMPAQPIKRRPRRTGQPLHLLLQDCSKQHISGYLCKKTAEEITAIVSDKKALAADLRNYSNDFVLTSARDRVIGEVDEQGKKLLEDVDPERDVIKQRFEDETSVFKSYDDAVHDIRVDLYLDGIKPRKQASEEDSAETATKNAELHNVVNIWDTFYKRAEIEPKRSGRPGYSPYPSRGGRPTGPPGTRPHPYVAGRFPPPASGSPHHGPPPASSTSANGPPFRDSRSPSRGYGEWPSYREDYYDHYDYYPDSRDDYRHPDYFDRRDPRDMAMRPPGPGSLAPPDPRDIRDPRDFRDRPPLSKARGEASFGAGSSRYDDRRRDRPDLSNAPPPRDSRHPGSHSATASPLTSHPSLPPKPASQPMHQAGNPVHPQHYPLAPHQQLSHLDPHAAQAGYSAYGQGYPMAGQTDYSGYAYAGYGQDPAAIAAQQQYAYSVAAGGWDMSANAAAAAATAHQVGAGLQLQPFASNQPGRHKAVPLPTDFMSGPSDAPRLSMPEPHEVLGMIRGVIIRDAHGNIGLTQYQFTKATQ